MLYACFNFTNEYYELKEIRADFNDRYKGLDEVSATVWVSLLRGWNNKQLKLVRTRRYFYPISHPLMESVKFARIKPLDSIKGKNLRKNRRLRENKFYFTGIEQEIRSHRRKLIHLHNQTR